MPTAFRPFGLACCLWAAVSPVYALAAAPEPKSEQAWDKAVGLRTELESSPAEQRTRDQYEAVLDAFRLIYHQNPTAAKAPAAVAAVADLLAEKGRTLNDQRTLRSAIGQYEFLREQYPDSPQVDNALLLEAEICRQDLKDAACAVDKLRAVVDSQPGTSFAEQADLELKQMAAESAPKPEARTVKKSGPQVTVTARNPALAPDDSGIVAPPQIPAPVKNSGGRVVTITGMRHWSNPTSTRIAIDLGGKVEYEAARVPNPDRIFFDLHGARLAPSLNGHQVEVVDDGYLKRIRAAQFHPDVTRVVLDVTDVSEYSAFLLPNPWRLIIDIHSDKSAGRTVANGRPSTVAPQTAQQPAPRAASSPSGSPSGGADSTIADVAQLSSEPARVAATAGPTSEPVSARVPGRTPGRVVAPAPLPRTAADPARPTVAPALPATGDTAGSASPASPANPANPASGLPGLPGSSGSSGSSSTRSRKKSGAGKTGAAASASPGEEAAIPHGADPDADGQRSLVRALGLKVGRIVIDPGHGGHDSGTLGPGGIQEKDVVLDVALRVGKLLHQRLGAEIVYTRDDDTFIPLETRTAIANRAQADLFLSIHGNSSPEPSARGVETYYLNFTSDPTALEVAARENALSSSSVHQLSDLVRKITLKDKIDESREFAADVDADLFAGLKTGNPGLRDRGVKKAPFVVLIGAQMPSILAEISFLTNPDDADELRQGSYRQRIAEALDTGVERYLRGLSGTGPRATRTAAKTSVASGEEPAGR
jgi:N-acetylmuramoyl-L-alanine amidase